MDNLTHTLVGMCLAEGLCQTSTKPVDSGTRKKVFLTSIIASNFPDLDLLYAWITPGPLGYLLHHRGHTHTFFIAVILTFLFFLGIYFRKSANTFLLTGACLGGLALHILMDGLNSYGVHPFWPWDNHWVYGDAVFIIEPLLYASLIPFFVRHSSHLFSRFLFGSLVVTTAGLYLFLPDFPLSIRIFGIVFLAGIMALIYLVPRRVGLLVSGASAIAVCVGFFGVSQLTKKNVTHSWVEWFPNETLEELVLSPQPSNIFCWHFISVSHEKEMTYQRKGKIAAFDKWFPAVHCPDFGLFAGENSKNLNSSSLISSRKIVWSSEYTKTIPEWKELASHCESREALRFYRNPFVEDSRLGDLRFDSNRRRSAFGKIQIEAAKACPSLIPPWVPPRINWMK